MLYTAYMTVDAEKIIQKLKGDEPARGRVTVYLNKDLFGDFKSCCLDVSTSASKVLEELMREFIQSAKSPTKESILEKLSPSEEKLASKFISDLRKASVIKNKKKAK